MIVVASLLIPAPLQEPADPATVPNPAKAGWFLLWIQEMVSWSALMVYPLILLALLFLILPWLSRTPAPDHASWFPSWNRWHWLSALTVAAVVVILTLLALLFRGENWRLTIPW